MPRSSRKAQQSCKPCPPTPIAHKESAHQGVDWALQEELCITCPCCGLRASLKAKDQEGNAVNRFTGEPYELRLYTKHFGGKTPAPEGTLRGHGRKAAKGVIIYEDVTGSEPGVLDDVLEKIKEAQGKEIACQPVKAAAHNASKRSTSAKRKHARSK